MNYLFLLFLLLNSLFSINAQNKKELKASLLRLKSDSTNMSHTLGQKNEFIAKKNIEIDSLNKIVRQQEIIIESDLKVISYKNFVIDSLELDAVKTSDSYTSVFKSDSFPSESKWISITLIDSLVGTWSDECSNINEESYLIDITKEYICIGLECEYGGSYTQIDYDLQNGQYRIKFINDNDMAGDDLPGEFRFYRINNKLSFFDRENNLRIFNNCND
jgi:hypothetical protein